MIPYETKDIRTITAWDTVSSGKTSLVESLFTKQEQPHASAALKTELQSQITTLTQKRRNIPLTLLSSTAIGRGAKSISSIRPDTSILFETLSPLLLLQKQPHHNIRYRRHSSQHRKTMESGLSNRTGKGNCYHQD